MHALWTLDGMDAIEPAGVIRALDDTSRDVRVSALLDSPSDGSASRTPPFRRPSQAAR
jgi:hypothetical protein